MTSRMTPMGAPPNRRMEEAEFVALADAHVAAQGRFVTEANALADELEEKADAVDLAKTAAQAAAAAAATSNAATQVARAAAEAAAGALGGELPPQAAYSRMVMRTDNGQASWGSVWGAAAQIQHSPSVRQLLRNSASYGAPWQSGANLVSLPYGYGGANGVARRDINVSGAAGTGLAYPYVPAQGKTYTLSAYFVGGAKPAAGLMLYAEYKDAGNVTRIAFKSWADADVIADGKVRRYSLTFTHAGADVTPRLYGVCKDTSAGTWAVNDVQLVEGVAPVPYVHTCEAGYYARLDMFAEAHIDSSGGSVGILLPDPSPPADTRVKVKCLGWSSLNKITCKRGANLIEGLAEDMDITTSYASTELVFNLMRGWVNV